MKALSLGTRIVGGYGNLRAWQLALLLVPLVFVSATLLRMNNLGMVERRSAVLTADQAGSTDDVTRSLADLQNYVSAHMNTDLGSGLYLKYSYQRAYDAALSAAAETNGTNPNSAVYQQASIDCRSRFKGGVESYRNDYVQCVVDRVSQLAPQAQATANLPSATDYRFDFVSPVWSPDFAGLAVALTALTALLVLIKGLGYLVFRLLVRRYYRRA